MKKPFLLLVTSVMLLICSCGKNDSAKESSQKTPSSLVGKGLQGWIYKNFATSADFAIKDSTTMYSDKSMSVMFVDAVMENQFGGHSRVKCQYVIYKQTNGKWSEYMSIAEPNKYEGWYYDFMKEYKDKKNEYWEKIKESIMFQLKTDSYGYDTEVCKFDAPSSF